MIVILILISANTMSISFPTFISPQGEVYFHCMCLFLVSSAPQVSSVILVRDKHKSETLGDLSESQYDDHW